MIVTTSRRSCVKSRKLCKELQSVIPLSNYILRGKKGLRELLSLSVEKGAERIIIVTSKKSEPFLLRFYSEWDFLGELLVSVSLRRELGINKVPPLEEDAPFLLKSSDTKGAVIADLFGADLHHGDATTYMIYEGGWIDFYRLDVSDNPVGPKIKVNVITNARHN